MHKCIVILLIMVFVGLMNNGNNLPTRTPNLEFSDEKQLNSGLN